ncbi:MAG: [FeFe] hydrogenase H-cluster maturation GTPase HydF [Clostridia bacterium]
MSLNDTPRGERIQIAFFGRRNAGKSSLVNAITGQALCVVSAVKGTTTDPVWKAMELLPLGPVSIIDTPGLDDEGELGDKRVQKAREVLEQTDIAVLVVDATLGMAVQERAIHLRCRELSIPVLIVYNKCDLAPAPEGEMRVSAVTGEGVQALKERLATLAPPDDAMPPIVSDLLHPNDWVLLVTPIDSAAPKGRLILPQQQTLRELLDADATAVVVKETQLRETSKSLGTPPAMVITDSQAFAKAAAETPMEIPLTSFSILMARHKGLLDTAVRGVKAIALLQDGDRVLISEGCTHHRQCGDIGSVKLPRWLSEHTGKRLDISLSSGGDFPADLRPYKLVLHCGGCMLSERAVRCRMRAAREQGVPMTNYGIAIAQMQGVLRRSLSVFPQLLRELDTLA